MRFTTILGNPAGFLATVLIAVCSASAQEPAPSSPLIHKLCIITGGVPTVYYTTTSPSPRLQALCRTLQWAENEVTLVDQLQQLKMEQVANERLHMEQRTAAMTNPGFIPFNYGGGCDDSSGCYGGETALSGSLAGQLAQEATPESALRMINLLEKARTDLDDELKKAANKDRAALEDDERVLQKAIAILQKKNADAKPAQPAPAIIRPMNQPFGVKPFMMSPLRIPAGAGQPAPAVDVAAWQKLGLQILHMQQEREAFLKERDDYKQTRHGSPADKKMARQSLQAARARYLAAMQQWKELSSDQAAAERERRAAAQSSGG